MKAKILVVMASTALGLWACGGDGKTDSVVDGGGNTVLQLDTPARIAAYLEGKKLEMTGPTFPAIPSGMTRIPTTEAHRPATSP